MKKLLLAVLLISFFISCRQQGGAESGEAPGGFTPVTVTHPVTGALEETVSLNATSIFLVKTIVRADVNGYLSRVEVYPAQLVKAGQVLFGIRSKESALLGNSLDKIDSSLHFSGLSVVKSPVSGYVSDVSHAVNDYVQDGDPLVTISDQNSVAFLLNLPYELTPFLAENKNVTLSLPDGRKIPGSLSLAIPEVDPVAQTQSYIIHISGNFQIPANLIASVSYKKRSKTGLTIVPREAVLTNEVQSEFWIMKLADSTTAIKVPVRKGMETAGGVEIVSPILHPSDLVLLTGNYGLPDTAKVVVENPE